MDQMKKIIKKSENMRLMGRWRYTLGFLGSAINFRFGKPQLGDILITDRCPVECRFCIYSCNMEGDDMNKEDISALVKVFAKYKIPYVRIMGGEPFLIYNKMIYCLKELRKYYKSNQITVVTSGYFATTKEKAIEKLKPLKDLGLIHLTLSYDTIHLESIKEEYYENAMKAATELGLHIELNITYNSKSHKLLPRIKYFIKKYGVSIAILKIYPFGLAKTLPKDEIFYENEDYHKFSKEVLYRRELMGKLKLDRIINFLYGTVFKNIMFCSHYTAFPNGGIYFCCVKQGNRLMGNFHKEELETLFKRVQKNWFSNAKRAIKFFFTTHSNASCQCEVCILDAKD